MAKTMFEKVWETHEVVPESADTPAVLFIDLHLTHEVTSPQSFTLLREKGLPVRRRDLTFATMDHSTPTTTDQVFGGVPIKLASARGQVVLQWRQAKKKARSRAATTTTRTTTMLRPGARPAKRTHLKALFQSPRHSWGRRRRRLGS